MPTTTAPRPDTTPTPDAPRERPRLVPAEERELREELVASALLLLAGLAVVAGVVATVLGALWLLG